VDPRAVDPRAVDPRAVDPRAADLRAADLRAADLRAADLLPIGRFARQSGLTVKALRHYDTLGLLSPARTDPATRRRWYAPAQLERARRIRRLRALDLPLAEVRAVLAAPDGGRALLIAYRRDVEARLVRDQRVLHGLVHLIEGDDMPETGSGSGDLPSQRQLAADLFNLVWTLLEKSGRTVEDDDRMVHAAHASRYHWGEVGGAEQIAIGEWQCARVYSVLGRAEPALHHARRCLEVATAGDVPEWMVASAHEGLARAYLVAGQRESALAARSAAEAALATVTDAEDRQVVQDDLASLPL
jgi:DNA-binding transcriptional MerR regulator